MSVFVTRLKELQASNSISSFALAEHLGISPDKFSVYENDIADPPVDMLIKLSAIFGVSVDYITGNTNTRKPIYDITWEEKEIVEKYRKMAPKDKKIFNDILFDLFTK